MKILAFFLVFISSFSNLWADTIKVAIIDTGLKKEFWSKAHLCKTGHKDFTGTGLNDDHGHGTNIAGTIINNAGNKGYCLILLKYYSPKAPANQALRNLVAAFQRAYDLNVDIINYSGGGKEPSQQEKEIVLKLLNKNVIVVAAAGNEQYNLDNQCSYYPACYDPRIFVISNHRPYANKGKVVDSYEVGTTTGFDVTESGTSQSTATFTGKTIKKLVLLTEKK